MKQSTEKLYELIEKFDAGMLTTKALDGSLHSRPMAIAKVGDSGNILLISDFDSQKVEEIEKDPSASFTFQTGSRTHVALAGTISISRDRTKIESLWNIHLDAWFEEGPKSANAVLLIFSPMRGEYWDTSGVKALRYALEIAKASVTDSVPDSNASDHAKVRV